MNANRGGRIASFLTAVLVSAPVAGASLLAVPSAQAIPEDGAGHDTAGTSASVSPSTLSAGAVISFRISGFPAGEIVNVKVDDGTFCSASGVHGACVVHQQRVSSSGSAQGSFALPGDLKPGKHWLRFLASKDLGSDASGQPLGTQGYTLRGGANFTIVAGGQNGGSGGATGTGPSGQTQGHTTGRTDGSPSGGQSDGTTSAATPGTASVDSVAGTGASGPTPGSVPSTVATPGQAIVLKPSAEQTTGSTTTPPEAVATAAADPSPANATPATAAAAEPGDRRVPWLGVGGGLLLLLAAAGLPFVRRRG